MQMAGRQKCNLALEELREKVKVMLASDTADRVTFEVAFSDVDAAADRCMSALWEYVKVVLVQDGQVHGKGDRDG